MIVHVSDKIYEDVSNSNYHFIAIALPSCDITLLKVVDVLSFENYTNEGDFLKGLVVLDEDEFFMAVREVLRKLSETITNNLIQKH